MAFTEGIKSQGGNVYSQNDAIPVLGNIILSEVGTLPFIAGMPPPKLGLTPLLKRTIPSFSGHIPFMENYLPSISGHSLTMYGTVPTLGSYLPFTVSIFFPEKNMTKKKIIISLSQRKKEKNKGTNVNSSVIINRRVNESVYTPVNNT